MFAFGDGVARGGGVAVVVAMMDRSCRFLWRTCVDAWTVVVATTKVTGYSGGSDGGSDIEADSETDTTATTRSRQLRW